MTMKIKAAAETLEPKRKKARTHRVQLKRTQHFKLEDALPKAEEYVTEVLQEMSTLPFFQKPFRVVKLTLALATLLLASTGTELYADFCTFIITHLWDVITAGDARPLSYAETLVIHYHAFRIDNELLCKWDSLLRGFSCGQLEADCLLQHLLDSLLHKLLTIRNSVDLPIVEDVIQSTPMTTNEEQVLAYVGGFIPFALRKHYRKMAGNATAQKYVDILTKWSVNGPYEGQFSFLEYTRKWIEAQSRGKLFQPNPHVFLFFRAAENEARKHLNTTLMGKYRDVNLRELLNQKLSKNYLMQQYWTKLVGDSLSCSESHKLFNVTVNYFVNIRCRAFVIVYIDLQKIKDKNLSKKGSHSLRKQLQTK